MNIQQQTLLEFDLPSIPGGERTAMERVAKAASKWLHGEHLERLKTAVAEGTLNAIEHGNQGRPELLVHIQVIQSDALLIVRITDQGSGANIPETTAPDLEAKLAGKEKPRGWGLFLIRNMVDEMNILNEAEHHTLELIYYLAGDEKR